MSVDSIGVKGMFIGFRLATSSASLKVTRSLVPVMALSLGRYIDSLNLRHVKYWVCQPKVC